MIVKKLYRRVKCRWWNKERKVFERVSKTDYLGWFLFGIIPVYLVQLDKADEYNLEDSEKSEPFTLRSGILEKYKKLLER
jgi:hypothetical protein